MLLLKFFTSTVDTEPWESDGIESLLRLMGHHKDLEEKQLMSNAVMAVFFLRALQAAGYFHGEIFPPRR